MHPKLSLIIVSWNVRDQLKDNLSRLFSLQTRASFEVLVIDNGSSDGTATMLRSYFPSVHLIQNDSNRGFAYACNQGLKMAKGDVLVLFNPDMMMGKGVMDHTIDTLAAHKDIGVMGVKLTRLDGSLVPSVRRDPGLCDQVAILLKLPHFFPHVTDRYLAKDFDYTVSQNVDQVRGSYFAFRRDVMENVGMLDAENFFIWFEEVDFCKRVRQAGFKIWYDARVSCTDLVGQSFKQQSAHVKQAWFSRSMARYFRKWHPAWQAAMIYALRPFVICLGAITDLSRFIAHSWAFPRNGGTGLKSIGIYFLTHLWKQKRGDKISYIRKNVPFSKKRVDIAIVTVSANRLDEACLASVRTLIETTPLSVKFILVDNASTTIDAHALTKKYLPEGIVILRDKNVGFGRSCNRGADEVDADYYFFLNPDTRVDDPEVLLKLYRFLKSYPRVGIAAPKILYMDGRLQETCRRFPSWFTPIAQRTEFIKKEKADEHRQDFLMEDFAHHKRRMVDWVQGSAFMIDGALFHELGGFDERYFMYYEDVDLCRTCWGLGRPVYYLPEAVLYHAYGKASAQGEGTIDKLLHNRTTRIHIESWLKYTLKWLGQKI